LSQTVPGKHWPVSQNATGAFVGLETERKKLMLPTKLMLKLRMLKLKLMLVLTELPPPPLNQECTFPQPSPS
jgi:hypothetical protein